MIKTVDFDEYTLETPTNAMFISLPSIRCRGKNFYRLLLPTYLGIFMNKMYYYNYSQQILSHLL